MKNLILRDYQNQAVNAVITQLNKPYNFENPVVCMPTGTGKSFVIAEIVRQLLQQKPTFTILVLTHVKELIQQNYDKFKIICPDTSAGIFSAGLNKKQLNHNVVFASIQSIINIKDNLNNIDFIIIDEAHRVPNDNESQYKNLINFLYTKNADLRIIGLTATPFRTGSGSILNDGIFTKIVFDNTQGQDFLSLIQNGYIVNLEPRETNIKINTDGVRITAGDYNQKDLQQVANKISLTTNILNNALELANNRNKFIIFASGVEHAKNISSYLNSQNVLTTYVASELKNIERDQRIQDFKNGKYKAIVNNDILTTGFDCPDIDCIIMMRPTLSPVLWVQMLGRGMRPSPNKTNCLVLDYTNNLKKLGEINNLKNYLAEDNIFEADETFKEDEKLLFIDDKICEKCGGVNKIRDRFCSNCGEPFNTNYNDFAAQNNFIKIDFDNNLINMDFQNGDIKTTAKVPKLLADFAKENTPRRYEYPELMFLCALTFYAYSQQDNFIVRFENEGCVLNETKLNLFSMCFMPSGRGITSTLKFFEKDLRPNFNIPAPCEMELFIAQDLVRTINLKKTPVENKKECLKQLHKIVMESMHYAYYINFLQIQSCDSTYYGEFFPWFKKFIKNYCMFIDDNTFDLRDAKDAFLVYLGHNNRGTNFNSVTTILNIASKSKYNNLLTAIKKAPMNSFIPFGEILMCDYCKNLSIRPLDPLIPPGCYIDTPSLKIFKDIIAKNLEPKIKDKIDDNDVIDFFDIFTKKTKRCDKKYDYFYNANVVKTLTFSEEAQYFLLSLESTYYRYFKKWLKNKPKYLNDSMFNSNLENTTIKIAALFHLAAGFDENTEISKEYVENALKVAIFYIKNSFQVLSNFEKQK